jgi:hypothetical protein
MTEKVKELSDKMLLVYRDNYSKMSEFLKKAEQKETELLQSNRLLNEEIQVLLLRPRPSPWSSNSTRRTSKNEPLLPKSKKD